MKPKVLFLARLYLPHVGGVEKHIQQISRQLISRYEITVVCHKNDSKLPDFEIIDGVYVYRLPGVEKWVVWRWFLHHIFLLANSDIIHVHDVFYWYLPFRFIFLFKPVFMTFHGYEGAGPPTKKQVFWHRLASFLTDGSIGIGGFHPKWYGVKSTFVSYGAA